MSETKKRREIWPGFLAGVPKLLSRATFDAWLEPVDGGGWRLGPAEHYSPNTPIHGGAIIPFVECEDLGEGHILIVEPEDNDYELEEVAAPEGDYSVCIVDDAVSGEPFMAGRIWQAIDEMAACHVLMNLPKRYPISFARWTEHTMKLVEAEGRAHFVPAVVVGSAADQEGARP